MPHGEATVRRGYTIASSPTQRDYIEITVKHAPEGVVSGYLHSEIHEGGLLDLSGPLGSFVFTGRECKCIVLIAGGVGITPLMSVLRYLLDRSWEGDIFLVYGCRAPEDIIFREELEYLRRRHTNLQVVITVSQSGAEKWAGPQGRITKELLAESIPDLPSRYIHICGPVPMMEATKQILSELGIPKDRIKTEAFGPALGKQERLPSADQKTAGPSSPKPGLPTVTNTRLKTTVIPPGSAAGGIVTFEPLSGMGRPEKTDRIDIEFNIEYSDDLAANDPLVFENEVFHFKYTMSVTN